MRRTDVVQLLVLYGHPEDPAAFEEHYLERHLALARAIPGLVELTTWKDADDGEGPARYYRTASLTFASLEDLRASLSSPEGQASGADAASIATGGVERLVLQAD